MHLSFFRLKEMKMMSIIREVLFYLLFLYVMMMVGYGNRDPRFVYVNQSMKDIFLTGNQYAGEFQDNSMDEVIYKTHLSAICCVTIGHNTCTYNIIQSLNSA